MVYYVRKATAKKSFENDKLYGLFEHFLFLFLVDLCMSVWCWERGERMAIYDNWYTLLEVDCENVASLIWKFIALAVSD